MNDDSTLLYDAPESFFDPAVWIQYLTQFPNREVAVYALSVLEPGSGDQRPCAILAKYLIDNFRKELRDGKIGATGLCALKVDRVPIPAERWEDLWPDFSKNRTRFGSMAFEYVRVSKTVPLLASDIIESCSLWLRQRPDAGESPKKVLIEEAREQFGNVLTTRDFDSAYKSVFNRRRGRPRRNMWRSDNSQ
jgi:hypothetical protein